MVADEKPESIESQLNASPNLLTEEEVAELLRLSVRVLRDQRRRRQLPGLLGIPIGRQIRYETHRLRAWWLEALAAQLDEEDSNAPGTKRERRARAK